VTTEPGDATKDRSSLYNSSGLGGKPQAFGGQGCGGTTKGFLPLHNSHVEHKDPRKHPHSKDVTF